MMWTHLTYANSSLVVASLSQYVSTHPSAVLVRNLGTQTYFSLLRHSAAMVGNSSSGIIEAASFGLPVVNIGNRQKGREVGPNVVHVPCGRDSIVDAIDQTLQPEVARRLTGLQNIYGDGRASERIVTALNEVPLDNRLLQKVFYESAMEPLS